MVIYKYNIDIVFLLCGEWGKYIFSLSLSYLDLGDWEVGNIIHIILLMKASHLTTRE